MTEIKQKLGFEDVPPPSEGHNSAGLIDSLRTACSEAVELETVISGYEFALKAAKQELLKLKTVRIPESMAEAGVGDVFSLDTGEVIKLQAFVHGSLPKTPDEKQAAFEELEKLEAVDLIKTVVKVNFGKTEKAEAELAVAKLKEIGIDAQTDETVHPQTLAAFARELLADGKEIDLEVLGLYAGTSAKITYPKPAKKKDF